MIEYFCEDCRQWTATSNCEHCGSSDTQEERW